MADDIVQTPVEGADQNQTKELTLDKLKAENQEQKGKIAGLNRSNTKMRQQLDKATSTGDAMSGRMKSIEDSLAQFIDTHKVSEGEEATAVKALTASRQKTEEASKVDPELVRLMEDVDENGLIVDFENMGNPDLTSPIIAKAFEGTQTASQARKALRKALKEQRDTDTKERITTGIQQALKEDGATVNGVKSSTTSGVTLTRENLGKVNMENAHLYKKVEAEFDEAIAKGTLK